MRSHFSAQNLFSLHTTSTHFGSRIRDIKHEIDSQEINYILVVDEEDYISYLMSKYRIEIPMIDFIGITTESDEVSATAKEFPEDINVISGQNYKIWRHSYFIPCAGDLTMLLWRPNVEGLGDPPKAIKSQDEIYFEIKLFYNTEEELNTKYQTIVDGLKLFYAKLVEDIQHFNDSLQPDIRKIYNTRRDILVTQNKLVKSLNVPLRTNPATPKTFSVPAPYLREKIEIKPRISTNYVDPDPSLSTKNYRDICKIINDVGKNFERMPSIYRDKTEPDLRDFILFVIDPNFELGSASGETFNKSGKTDILLRYDSSVVFVAECKFWTGMKDHFKTIDQLIGYLTWRDTKTAIVLFVAQKKIANVLSTIRDETKDHPNFVSALENTAENWFNFVFHLPGDTDRKFELATLIYHLPELVMQEP